MSATPKQPPAGYALVPTRLTPAMEEVIQEDGWDWPDLLAAAESITQEQYDALLDAAPMQEVAPWEPHFDVMAPEQERLVHEFCHQIAGARGQRGSPPDPVRLLEMAAALYQAERDYYLSGAMR